jgi:subtilisin family serine protease
MYTILKKTLGFALLLCSLTMAAQNQFVLVTSPSKVQDVCGRHGLSQIGQLTSGNSGNSGTYLVVAASVDPSIATDPDVQSFEADHALGVSELSGTTQGTLLQSAGSVLDQLPARAPVTYFGSTVANYYVLQPASTITRLGAVQSENGLTGAGVLVAVIDTGVDPSHPALAGALITGYDFVHNTVGGSELVDLSADQIADLSQSNTSILDGGPKSFGHGTMTAGLVHLVAPNAKIMPLKAFTADGGSDLYNILRAIRYAVDHGANVISMSFEITQSSPALQNAIQYALSKNVTIVAASGNDGQQILVYPAAYNSVIGVGSTSNQDGKSSFTNFGTNAVYVAAPGEGVITTFPGGHYAAGWGTSFSAPMVAGEAAIILQARPSYKPNDVANAISRSNAQIPQMGHGRVDLCQAVNSLGSGVSCH